MPNWTMNSVTVQAPHEQVREYLTNREDKLYFNMAKLFPERFWPDENDGSEHWDYEWACENTGSKWFPEIGYLGDLNDETIIEYESAWSPNNKTLERLHELTGWTIVNEYEEPGNAFEGTFICRDGQCVDDERIYRSRCHTCGQKKLDVGYDPELDDMVCMACRKKTKRQSE